MSRHFNEGNLAQFGRSAKKFKIVEVAYVVSFEFSRPKVSSSQLMLINIHVTGEKFKLSNH